MVVAVVVVVVVVMVMVIVLLAIARQEQFIGIRESSHYCRGVFLGGSRGRRRRRGRRDEGK